MSDSWTQFTFLIIALVFIILGAMLKAMAFIHGAHRDDVKELNRRVSAIEERRRNRE